MTGRTDFDRAMTAYLEERETISPDGLLDTALSGVDATRQRPPWLVPGWWLPVDRSGVARLRTAVVILLAVAAIVAGAIAAGLLVGSQRRLPPPFGIAKPGLIAFDEGGHIVVANPDGSSRKQITTGRDGYETFSPDGTWIAYQTEGDDLTSSVVVVSPDGNHRVILAEHLVQIGNIVWSPNSHEVAFGARIAGSFGSHVFTAEIARPGAVRLGRPDLFGVEPSWSPDGSKIAFKHLERASDVFDDGGSLWLMGADGSDPHPISSLHGTSDAFLNTAWSPDGRRIAFLAPGRGTNFDVYVIDADGGDQRNLTDSPEDEYWPSWSPNGTRIAFANMSLTARNQGTVVVVDPDGSHRLELTGTPVNRNTLIWSPDGTRLLAYAKNPDPNVDRNVAIAIFDPTRDVPPTVIPATGFKSASWQRLAP